MESFNTLQSYLNHTGVLSWGTPEEVAQHKRQYRKAYHRHWRRRRRKERPELTVSFPRAQYRKLRSQAKRHSLAPTQFAQAAIEAYLNTAYIIPHRDELGKITQHLRLFQTQFNRLSSQAKADSYEEYYSTYRLLAHKVHILEEQITSFISTPKYDHQDTDQ